jgi:hypothetical protein
MVEHARVFEVIAFGEDTWVCVGGFDFAYKNGVVSCWKLAVKGAFDVGDAFFDGWGFDFFPGRVVKAAFLSLSTLRPLNVPQL